MLPSPVSSASIFRSRFRRITTAVALIAVMVPSSWGQTPSSNLGTIEKPILWRKYVNKQHAFSFWYPDTYQRVSPTDTDGRCNETENSECLLWLARRDDPNTIIWVGIFPPPFRVHPGSGDVMPTRQRIGHHVFVCGMVGSMGVGYDDFFVLNLKGRALEFQFSPTERFSSNEKTDPLAPKMLKTFRTF